MITKSDLENMMKTFEIKPEEFGLIKNLKPPIPGEVKQEDGDSVLEVGDYKVPIYINSAMPEDQMLMVPGRLLDAIKRRSVKDALDIVFRDFNKYVVRGAE
jgi:hypothetical protein